MKIGELRTVEGDVTEPQRSTEDELVIIPHCCNDLGVMGAGVAFALKKKWPGVDKEYKAGSLHLGSVTYYIEDDGTVGQSGENPRIRTVVANMIGQKDVVGLGNSKPVKYWALAEAMRKVATFCDATKLGNPNLGVVIHCPKFGSDLAGGDWNIVLELIKEIWIENGYDVVVYEFVPECDRNRKKKTLYKTTIEIWSDEDSFTSYPDLETLAREATSGDAYCTKQDCVKVDDIYFDEDYDGLNGFFFGMDGLEELECENFLTDAKISTVSESDKEKINVELENLEKEETLEDLLDEIIPPDKEDRAYEDEIDEGVTELVDEFLEDDKTLEFQPPLDE